MPRMFPSWLLKEIRHIIPTLSMTEFGTRLRGHAAATAPRAWDIVMLEVWVCHLDVVSMLARKVRASAFSTPAARSSSRSLICDWRHAVDPRSVYETYVPTAFGATHFAPKHHYEVSRGVSGVGVRMPTTSQQSQQEVTAAVFPKRREGFLVKKRCLAYTTAPTLLTEEHHSTYTAHVHHSTKYTPAPTLQRLYRPHTPQHLHRYKNVHQIT